MYNRYIRNDNGAYTRMPQHDEPRQQPPKPSPPPPPQHSPHHPPKDNRLPESKFLDRLLGKLHLGDVDSGDLILLLLLFILFKEEADEELLIAIGLLLII